MLRVSKSAFQSASKHLYREFSFEHYKKLEQGCSLEVGDITTVGNLHYYLSNVRILSLSTSSKNIEFSDWTKLFKTFPHASRITKYDQILYRGFNISTLLNNRPTRGSSRTLAHHYGRVKVPIGWQENVSLCVQVSANCGLTIKDENQKERTFRQDMMDQMGNYDSFTLTKFLNYSPVSNKIVLTIIRELDQKRLLEVTCLSFLRLDQDMLEIIRLLSRSLLTVSQHPKDWTETGVTFEQLLGLLHWDGLRKLSTVDFGSYRLRPSSRFTDASIPDSKIILRGYRVAKGSSTYWSFMIYLKCFSVTDIDAKTSKSAERYARESAKVSRQYLKTEKTTLKLSVTMVHQRPRYRYETSVQIDKAFEKELSGAQVAEPDVGS
ncbi:hypothetical protein I203_100047 [Kwoniella mangroviensis CBS 8507]|uniref:uncharacterized protein n=1 Tax=Kwoniella mangroviensis CBS 8507 TaxID=1296122 RepID=UPI00080CDDC8|nr:uncharacterized protein I203_07990 [Kwoniella mangroviensis CBS 8507]OCF63009.1 hypothetical protein I203_07990 [Kwoniella mangroviensis CBS 8507]